jgi:hypothetical protein
MRIREAVAGRITGSLAGSRKRGSREDRRGTDKGVRVAVVGKVVVCAIAVAVEVTGSDSWLSYLSILP